MISLQTGVPIHVKLPRVYRYMNQEYVDRFFEDGALRISSFSRFMNYPDEVRGDRSEGGGSVVGKGDNNFTLHLFTRVGQNGYMLCASLEESEAIQKEFQADSYLIIKDPLAFHVAVMGAVPGMADSFLGFCDYRPARTIHREVPGLSGKDMLNEEGRFVLSGATMLKQHAQLVGNGIDLLFLKYRKYQYQAEFRFVWTIKSAFFEMQDYLDIKCKEAIQFCERGSGMVQPDDD
jgi:hypothetical protein